MIITIETRKASLKRKIRRHLRSMGFARDEKGLLVPPDLSKDTYRALHAGHRIEKLRDSAKFLARVGDKLLPYFADGIDVNPELIRPRLEVVSSTALSGDIFRYASLFWRVPVSEGYGRRVRFLVWDDSNDKLIGIFALGDAVFNLKVRDEKIGWDHLQRAKALVNMMDAYVLGAVPPYSYLLGGKLVASLLRTKEVVDVFNEKYRETTGIISGEKKQAKLVALTTTSSLGRSSIYNRLRLVGTDYFSSIGFTSGWGHFHIPDRLFAEMRQYLEDSGDTHSKRFLYGHGPNYRMRTIRRALDLLGMDGNLIQHGLPREVFFCSVADNATKILTGKNKRPVYSGLKTVEEVAALAKDRWVIPRSERNPEYRSWVAETLKEEFRAKGDTVTALKAVMRAADAKG